MKKINFRLMVLGTAVAIMVPVIISMMFLSGCSSNYVNPDYPVGSKARFRYDEHSPILNVYSTSANGEWIYVEYTDSIGEMQYETIDTMYLTPYRQPK